MSQLFTFFSRMPKNNYQKILDRESLNYELLKGVSLGVAYVSVGLE